MNEPRVVVRKIDLEAPAKPQEVRDYIADALSFAGDHVGVFEMDSTKVVGPASFEAVIQRSHAFQHGRNQRIKITVEVLDDTITPPGA